MRGTRFAKLMSALQSPEKKIANPGIDNSLLEKEKSQAAREQQLAIINSKIAQLEDSNDPNSLESLNFWKKKKAELGFD